LGAGGAFAANALLGDGSEAKPGSAASGKDDRDRDAAELVVNNPPSLGASFAGGYEEAWRVDGASYLSTAGDLIMTLAEIGADGPNGSPAVEFRAVEADSGQVRWDYPGDGELSNSCDDGLFGDSVTCWITGGLNYPNVFLNEATGREEDPPDWGELALLGDPAGRVTDGDLLALNYLANDQRALVARVGQSGTVKWRVDGGGDHLFAGEVVDGVLATRDSLGDGFWGPAFDWETGARLAPEQCPRASVWPGPLLACRDGSGDFPAQTKLSDGRAVTLVRGDPDWVPVEFASGHRPALGLMAGPGQVVAVDPATGEQAWSVDLEQANWPPLEGDWDGLSLVALTHGDESAAGPAWQIDIAAGVVLWQNSEGMPCAHTCGRDVYQLGGGAALVSTGFTPGVETPSIRAFGAGGEVVWEESGVMVRSAPLNADGAAEYLVVEGDGWVARWDPGDRRPSAEALPAGGLPDCPGGLEPISWVEYSDGLVLICAAQDAGFAVLAERDGQDLTAEVLTFTADGWEVEFADSARLVCSLWGALVTVITADAERSAYLSSSAWSLAASAPAITAPRQAAPMPGCPAETRIIALSTWADGWLLICGADSATPDWAVLAEGADQPVELSDLRTVADGYCGQADSIGRVCAYRSPALVTFGEGDGLVQVSVAGNYFRAGGFGGAGKAKGAYGVQAPTDTAEDQVRYLVEILEKSASARAQLGPAVTAVAQCQSVSTQVATLAAIAQNRQELLTALDSAPVDKVPDGVVLVNLLRAALEASLGSDQSYLAWAEAQASSGCASGAGQSHYDAAAPFDTAATAGKAAFVAQWNNQIAPAYGVRTFQESEI
jgi:outer membrane protein assembly factor BamB